MKNRTPLFARSYYEQGYRKYNIARPIERRKKTPFGTWMVKDFCKITAEKIEIKINITDFVKLETNDGS